MGALMRRPLGCKQRQTMIIKIGSSSNETNILPPPCLLALFGLLAYHDMMCVYVYVGVCVGRMSNHFAVMTGAGTTCCERV
ncbi:hypothetical protein BCR43DRAFT_494248 [Syncephalastrum racemosum]|uniref:Uncharacterized protein n=1 Tax=Syncephalastrum racemosum TaxID=13706 RepID=A0A1X2H7N9_SYNRA|nr:hypothetical protein BCR43DRAFT_494248 [Syncephalastrum racemosum]